MRATATQAAGARNLELHRVVVAGFSQGGAISLAIGLNEGATGPSAGSHLKDFAGVAAFCGYLPPLSSGCNASPEKSTTQNKCPRLVQNFFLAQGGRDMCKSIAPGQALFGQRI